MSDRPELHGHLGRDASVTGRDGDGDYAYSPAAVHVDPGTHVEFRWDSSGHNVIPEEKPGARPGRAIRCTRSNWASRNTLEIEGTYTYYCGHNRDRGMKGAIVVGSPRA
jgi:plastocyanin